MVDQTAAIDLLLKRNSMKLVQAPGPSDEELATILQAAMTAPDHGALRPWRFKVIRGEEAVQQFAELSFKHRQASAMPFTEEKLASSKAWLADVPLIIAVAAQINHQVIEKIDETEQLLATGAAMTQILNACHFLGYGAFWSTGIATYIEDFQTAIGFDPLDYRFMGFIAIGTPKMAIPQKERPNYQDFTTMWTGSGN
ncbi:nitroreductase [Oligella urethralis]|uniref:Putative NAD(P)H nitroreductase n=1 Tax=Oligella urethralis DNF00040 TaxID=1401065 RepID=A0A095Z944_9BURK|nr:nitroreductase [Oligella urethralis]KGF31265.1 nitroreductase [Oligella urethralis DNF00040]PMC17157.1 nitroreductase [Oligella urethralis]SUA59721.1 Putative NAD(P)H nitroreductase ydjA [Oligella urethralis]